MPRPRIPIIRRVVIVVAAVAVASAVAAVAAPAYAATGLTATFSSANHGSWHLDKYVVANPTSAAISG